MERIDSRRTEEIAEAKAMLAREIGERTEMKARMAELERLLRASGKRRKDVLKYGRSAGERRAARRFRRGFCEAI